MTDLLTEAKAISASTSPKIRAYAIDQAAQFLSAQKEIDELKALVAELQAGGTAGGSVAGPDVYARAYGFEPHVNGAIADTWWTNLLNDLAGTPESLTVEFPPGFFMSKVFHDWSLAHLLFVGRGGNPKQFDTVPDPRARTTFGWDGGSGAPMFGQDGGTGILKPGVVCQHIDFYNARRPGGVVDYTIDAILTNNVNDGALEHCGFNHFGKNLHLTAAGIGGGDDDNAHWDLLSTFSYGSDAHVYATACLGVNIERGEIIGLGAGRGQYAFYLGPDASEVTIDKTKAVGCANGFCYNAGGGLTMIAARGEDCGDATHPVIDIVDGGDDLRGNYSVYLGCMFNGRGTQLPSKIGAGCYNQHFLGTRHINMGAHPGLRGNEILNASGNNSHTIIDDYMVVLGVPGWTKWAINGQALRTRATGVGIE